MGQGTAFETTPPPDPVRLRHPLVRFPDDADECDRGDARVRLEGQAPTTQDIDAPLLAQVSIEYPNAQASLVFDAHTRFGRDSTACSSPAAQGTISQHRSGQDHQQVELTTAAGVARPKLVGSWFPDGFHGTMAELLASIEEQREPMHSARNNLASLALCFAAVASAERGEPVVPGTVQQLP